MNIKDRTVFILMVVMTLLLTLMLGILIYGHATFQDRVNDTISKILNDTILLE